MLMTLHPFSCMQHTKQVCSAIPANKLCGCVSTKHYKIMYLQPTTMTSHQNAFRFLKAGPYDGTSDDF